MATEIEHEQHYYGDTDDWLLRLSKVVAIKEYVVPGEVVKWIIVSEGGYSLDTCDRDLAHRVIGFLNSSNASDERFFTRGAGDGP